MNIKFLCVSEKMKYFGENRKIFIIFSVEIKY